MTDSKVIDLGYVSIARCEECTEKKLDWDERVLNSKILQVVFDYPLERGAGFEFKSDNGFTRGDIIRHICETYKKIYDEEAKSTKAPVESIAKRSKGASMLMNRARTDGKWGIWGHSIEDLILHTLHLGDDGSWIIGLDS